MAESDDRRVEGRPTSVGWSLGNNVEKIRELQARRAEFDKRVAPKPGKSFSSILSKRVGERPESEISEKDCKLSNLPKKGPRINRQHSRILTEFWRPEEDRDVVLKG